MICGHPVILSNGGETASIVLTVTHGATDVSCTTPSGLVLTGTCVAGTETDVYTFSRLNAYGDYTCSATYTAETKTATITIDSAIVYYAVIKRAVYLYNQGDECTSVTGGWSFSSYWSHTTTSVTTITKGSSSMTITLAGTMETGQIGGVATNSTIDLTNYSMLYMTGSGSGTSTAAHQNWLAQCAARTSASTSANTHRGVQTPWSGTLALDISSINEARYVAAYCYGNATITQTITKIWLE